MASGAFAFLDPGTLVDDDLELLLVVCAPGDGWRGWAPSYRFAMRRTGTTLTMGEIGLRVGHTERLERYAGHIGYHVEPPYRGHHYAARSVRLLLPLARAHGLDPLWITCNPDNWASRRTCELAGGQLVGIVDLPPDDEIALRGEPLKCRYRFDLA